MGGGEMRTTKMFCGNRYAYNDGRVRYELEFQFFGIKP